MRGLGDIKVHELHGGVKFNRTRLNCCCVCRGDYCSTGKLDHSEMEFSAVASLAGRSEKHEGIEVHYLEDA